MLGTTTIPLQLHKEKKFADTSACGASSMLVPPTQQVQHQAFKDTAQSMRMHGYILLVVFTQAVRVFTGCWSTWSPWVRKLHRNSLQPQIRCFT